VEMISLSNDPMISCSLTDPPRGDRAKAGVPKERRDHLRAPTRSLRAARADFILTACSFLPLAPRTNQPG
jgi:hypothetical protein